MRRKQRGYRLDHRFVEQLEQRRLLTTYFVDNNAGANGSNSNSGTSLSAPFLTIQQAANVAEPGDTVDIVGGTYREQVIPAHSGTAAAPIIYQPYDGQTVVVSGANIVSGWSNYSGNIYETSSMSWTMGGQDDQVFVNGQMVNYARWPNTSLDVSNPTVELAGANTTGVQNSNGTITETVYDSNLTQPAGYWNGATIHIESGATWIYEAATITNYTRAVVNGISYGVITYTSSFNDPHWYAATPGDPFYITGDPYFTAGSFQTLNSAGEFYRDPNTGLLYLWTPGGESPASDLIEAKAREWAFDLSGLSYIDIDGLNLFAAGINSSATSSHLLFNGINAQYVSQFENYTGNWTPTLLNGTNIIGGTGIVLDGGYDTIENSTIAYSAGDGIYLGGSNNTVYNNIIHDVDYSGVNASGIDTAEFTSNLLSNNSISNNTLYNAGRSLINVSALSASRVDYNRLSDAMLQAGDGGAIYGYGATGNGTEIDNNIVTNCVNVIAGFPVCGIFLDYGSTGFTIDHNVIDNANEGIKVYLTGAVNFISNTILNSSFSFDISSYTASGLLEDNLSTAGMNLPFTNNALTIADNLQTNNPLLVSPLTGNYQLQSGSPAINAGTVAAPYTNGYVGSAPDLGAYEYGATPWTAGASSAAATLSPPAPFTAGDIGSPSLTGSTSYSSGVFTVSGSGDDIWNSSDQFQFASTPVSGNQTLIARLTSQSDTNVWAKAGVMFRSTSSASSAFVAVFQTPGSGVNLMWRDGSGNLNYVQAAGVSNPVWLKLVRNGNVFTGFDSSDGVNWTQIGAVTISLPTTGLMGLAVCSHDNTQISTATFDNVTLQLTAPTGLVVSAAATGSLSLSWNADATASSYQIQRSTDGVNFSPIATLAAVTSYTDPATLQPGTEYYYRIIATNALDSSPVSAVASATVPAPATPAGVTAAAGVGAITLSWTAGAYDTAYNIYRATTPGGESATPLASGVTSTSYTDTTASPGITFYYTVTGVNGSASVGTINQSAPSAEVSAASFITAVYDGSFEQASVNGSYAYDPATQYWKFSGNAGIEANGSAWGAAAAPYGTQAAFLQSLNATSGGTISQTITVADAGSFDFSFFSAQRLSYGTEPIAVSVDGTLIATITPGSTTFQSYTTPAVTLSAGSHILSFATTSTSSIDSASFIDQVSVAVLPNPPTAVTATAGTGQITLSWTAPLGAVSYSIFRGTTSGGEATTPLASNVTANSYTDTTAAAGTTYYYTVSAINAAGQTATSAEVSASVSDVQLTGTPIGTAGSWDSDGNTIANVFDGNLSTYFDAPDGNLTDWVGLNLGSPQQITQISYAPRAGYEFRMLGGEFQVSNTADFSSGVVTLYTISTTPDAGQLTTINVNPGGSYQYVRFVGGTQWVNIAEMKVFGIYTAPPVQLTGSPIGTAGSWDSDGNTISNVFDGNLNTFFDAPDGNLTDWVGLNLGSPQQITQISYAPRAGYEFRMLGGEFQVSNTADFSSGVVTLYTISTTPVAGQLTTINVNPGGSYQYVRFVGGTQWVNIAEMKVFGIYTPPPVELTGTPIGTAGSWANDGDTIANVFDGNLTTFFDPPDGTLTDWAGLNLGSPQTITEISYAPRAGYEFRMIGGEFQVSNTADFSSGVVTVYTIQSAPVAGQLTTVNVTVPGQYQYIRYIGGTQWVNIAEMQVFGPG
jgi:parallel beta-helix repeat protein